MTSTESVAAQLASQGSAMDKVKNGLGNLVTKVKQAGETVNENVVQPLNQAYKNVKETVDVYKEGAESIGNLAKEYLSADDISGEADALTKFDGKWDKFAADFDKKFNKSSSTSQTNILEEFARNNFGDKVFAAGSIVKNEAPAILGGIASIEKNLGGFAIDPKDPIGTAKNIKDSTEAILKAAKDIDGSLNNVFTRATKELGVNATALISLQDKLHDVIATASASVPQALKDSLARTGDGIEVLNSAKILVTAIVSDLHDPVTPATLAKLSANINTNWDAFAKTTNELFKNLTKGKQENILEAFAKSQFGDNVFYAGSAIKQGMPGIFSGISDFQNAISAFGGSYRNPVEAAQKIKNGVEGIVKATEKIAASLNKMVGIYSGRGDLSKAKDIPVLNTLSKLGDTRMMRSLDSVLKIGAAGTALTSSTASAIDNLKSGNLKGAADDAKNVLKQGKTVVDEVRNFGKNKMGGPSSGGGDKKSNPKKEDDKDKEKEKEDQNLQLANTDTYVCSGATIKCTFGNMPAKLMVYPDRTVYLTGQPMANISDHIPNYNIQPFGLCSTTNFPSTGSATSANYGVLTPMPCIPNTVSDWINGKNDYIIKGKPALLKSSFCKCMWGGIITITDDGQTDTGPADLSRKNAQTEEEILKKQEENELEENAKLDVNSVLDGIQTALDLAGFAPGVGAVPDLLNAAISACRGNWGEAGLSVLAAVPGIGDAAAGVKLANRGVKMAKAAKKVEKTAEVGKSVKNASKVDGATKQVSKVENKPTDISEYRKAKQDRLIDESPNVKRFPERKVTTDTPAASVEKGRSGEVIHMDKYEVKQVKVGNGKTENVLEKRTDTIVDSIGGASGGGSINRPYTTTGNSSDLPVQPINKIEKTGEQHKGSGEYAQHAKEAMDKSKKKGISNTKNILEFGEKTPTGDDVAKNFDIQG